MIMTFPNMFYQSNVDIYYPFKKEDEKYLSRSKMLKKEQKRRPKPKDGSQLQCGVCGDKALGYNFDAVTCESCKAFFRRNALKSKTFSCSFDGSCKLDPHTRKFCSACRLKKCFIIGMKKDWILSLDMDTKVCGKMADYLKRRNHHLYKLLEHRLT